MRRGRPWGQVVAWPKGCRNAGRQAASRLQPSNAERRIDESEAQLGVKRAIPSWDRFTWGTVARLADAQRDALAWSQGVRPLARRAERRLSAGRTAHRPPPPPSLPAIWRPGQAGCQLAVEDERPNPAVEFEEVPAGGRAGGGLRLRLAVEKQRRGVVGARRRSGCDLPTHRGVPAIRSPRRKGHVNPADKGRFPAALGIVERASVRKTGR